MHYIVVQNCSTSQCNSLMRIMDPPEGRSSCSTGTQLER